MNKKLCIAICSVLIVVLLYSCRNSDANDMPIHQLYVSDRQISFGEFNNADTIILNSKIIIISNPYKHVGNLRLKGSMHNHTTNSDGSLTPIEAAKIIRDKGEFDFYTITDHNYITLDPGVGGIVWMGKSLEDTKGVQDDGQHLCIYNLPTNFNGYHDSENINELISKYSSQGALINYAHPNWSWQVQPSEKIASVNRVRFVEVLNSRVGGSERAYNILLTKFGKGIYGFGVDDFHDDSTFNKSWIVVYADSKDKTNIWEAILRGAFYASKNGGEMEISCNNGIIKVSTEDGSTISFIGKESEAISESGLIIQETNNTNTACYSIKGNEGYVYVRVQKGDKTAISQAVIIL